MTDRLKEIEAIYADRLNIGSATLYEALAWAIAEIHCLTEELSEAHNDLALCGGVLAECQEKEIRKQASKEVWTIVLKEIDAYIRMAETLPCKTNDAIKDCLAAVKKVFEALETTRDMKCPCEIGEIEGCPQDASCPEMKGER